jgi:hypothetical protein
MTFFLLGHHCDACGLGIRTRNLRRGLSEPGFETGLAEPCVIARNFAGIFQRGQPPLDQFIHAELFRASNFDDAVYRLA